MEKRKSSDLRIKTGTFLSGNPYTVYLSTNFAWSTALKHDFSLKDSLHLISKYSLSSLFLSFSYFTLNEHITFTLQKNSIKNFFLSHSLTSLIIIPIFTLFQKSVRQLSWSESRFLSYRYVGTLCCGSLVAELLIAFYRHTMLDNIRITQFDVFNKAKKKADMIEEFERLSGTKISSE